MAAAAAASSTVTIKVRVLRADASAATDTRVALITLDSPQLQWLTVREVKDSDGDLLGQYVMLWNPRAALAPKENRALIEYLSSVPVDAGTERPSRFVALAYVAYAPLRGRQNFVDLP